VNSLGTLITPPRAGSIPAGSRPVSSGSGSSSRPAVPQCHVDERFRGLNRVGGGGFQEISVRPENSRQAAGPRGDAPDVRPPAGEALLEKRLAEMFGPGSQRVHAAQARRPARDVHGPGVPFEDALFSITSPSSGDVGLSEAGLPASGILRGFGGTTRIHTEIIGVNRPGLGPTA
jgi:hypothetical protein